MTGFPTVQDAKSAIISGDVFRIITDKYSAMSKGGGAQYRRSSLPEILTKVAPNIPEYVRLFIPMNGPTGATEAYDLSMATRTVSAAGQFVVSDAHSYYDQNMGYFDGVGDTISVPASVDFAPSGTFAMSIGALVEDLAAERPLWSWTTNSTTYAAWVIKANGSVEFRQVIAGTTNIQITSAPGVVQVGALIELGLVRYGSDQWSIVLRDPSKHSNQSKIIAAGTDNSPLILHTSTVRIGQIQATAAGFKGWLGQFWFKKDPSWEGAEDYLLLPTKSYFQSADGAWWLLDSPSASPEMFGAAGNAVMDPSTGLISGTNDRVALRECQQYCAILGKEMHLVSQYWWSFGEWAWRQNIVMRGANRRDHGIFIDTDATQPGILWLAEDNVINECFLSVRVPKSIQNGQGYYGTVVTFSRAVQRAKTRHSGESAEDYGLRCLPGPVTGEIRNVRALRRAGGVAHCFCATSRTKGILLENIDAFGWSSKTGRHGTFWLTHWGFVGEDFRCGVDGIVIEPSITHIANDTYTMHPSGCRARNIRLRNVGRLLNTSACYDVEIDGWLYLGTRDGSSGDGGQIVAHTCGDEWDRYVGPDDKGLLWANMKVSNGVGRVLEAASPNDTDRALISMVSTATSKVRNIDGTFAKDDLAADITYTPGTIPANGGTVVKDVAVPGVRIGDSPNVKAWFSTLGDDSSKVISASVVSNDVVRCTFTNKEKAPLILTSPGTLNAYLPRKRAQFMATYSGVETKNIRCYGASGTGHIMYLRNGQGQARFENIQYVGEVQTDGLSLQNWRGPLVIDNCKFPGDSDIGSSEGIEISNCIFESNAIFKLTVGKDQAEPFRVGDELTGATSGVQGYIHEIPEVEDKNVLYVRLKNGSGEVFTAGDVISSVENSATINAIAIQSTANMLVRGSIVLMTLASQLNQWDETLLVNSIPIDLRPGDKITYDGGTIWVKEYHDNSETAVKISPAPRGASAGTTFTVDRRSRLTLRNVSLVGGYRGLQVNQADLIATSLRITQYWQYGILQETNTNLVMNGVTFEGGGVIRIAYNEAVATRDYIAAGAANGSFTGRGFAFRNGKYVSTNFVVAANSLLQGALYDSTFIAMGEEGAPVAKTSVVTPLKGGAAFSFSNNVDTSGAAVSL